MLTKDDFKEIRKILKEEVKPLVQDEIANQLKKELTPIHNHLDKIDDTLEVILRLICYDYAKIQSLESRISRLESHLHLSPTS